MTLSFSEQAPADSASPELPRGWSRPELPVHRDPGPSRSAKEPAQPATQRL